MINPFTLKNLAAAAALSAAVAGSSALSAQGSDDVTVLLRSGERVAVGTNGASAA